ncbi:MAG: DUF4031 domain-containing protein [Acidimicrobiales bacterium]
MAILVDEATWPFRGDRWAHLVSDESFDELHRFAQRLGLRRLSFQGDHYDVPAALRLDAIRNGALSVTGRELVRRLRAAGLRRPGSGQPWTRVLEIAAGARLDDAARARIDVVLAANVGADRRRSVAEALSLAAPHDPRLVGWGAWCLTRSGELAIAADLHPEDALPPADIAAMLTQSGVFDAVYCWSRDDATTIEMMVPLS